jgi:hypothetical protein
MELNVALISYSMDQPDPTASYPGEKLLTVQRPVFDN